MKTPAFLICLSFFSFCKTSLAQIEDDMLDINNFHIPVNSQAMLGFVEGTPGYSEVPAGSGVPAFLLSTLWVGARDNVDGSVRGFVPMYYTDYNALKPGPIFSNLHGTDSLLFIEKYNRVWKITRTQIDYHKENYYKSGYIMPEALLNWPANGDTLSGVPQLLSPFTDYNNNRIYEPELGEYPNIKGDEAILVICSDGDYDEDSVNFPMDLEIHLMIYAYAQSPATLLGNTVFVNYNLYNRSENSDYDSLFTGQFVNFSLGCNLDDYIGSDSINNLFYVYNADKNDSGLCFDNYGNILPSVGSIMLSNKMYASMYLIGDNTPMRIPSNAMDAYYNLRGYFKDGTKLTYGGNGYGGELPVNYVYPSDVNDPEGWTEITQGNASFERRGVSSMGPFQLNRNESICIESAFIFAQSGIPDDNLASVDLLKTYAAQLKDIYPFLEDEQCVTYKTAARPEVTDTTTGRFLIYPQPAHDAINILTNLFEGESLTAELYDATGRLMHLESFVNSVNNQLHTIGVTGFAHGFYLLRLNYGGHEFSEKILIQ